MLPFELLFREIKTNDLTTSQSNSIKSKLLDTPFTSYNFFGRERPVSNLSEAELNALENLTKNKNLVIQKVDKDNTAVIINKNDYKIKDILSDSTKFKKLEIGENKQLIFLINSETKLKDIIKPFIKTSVLLRKNMTAFTQRYQDQQCFTAVLRYINLSLVIVPPFGTSYLL